MAKFKAGDRVIIADRSDLHGRIAKVSDDSVKILSPREGIVYVRVGEFHLPFSDQELRVAFQTCKDCKGYGWIPGPPYAMEASYKCPTCKGTGRKERTGPYRLADGTWSDGVDRSTPLIMHDFGSANEDRMTVFWMRHGSKFGVSAGNPETFTEFDSFAEAIAYADAQARTTKNGDA